MSNEWNLIELDDFGVLRLRGADGVRFLQGQVSNDVEQLTPERSQIAGYHNPQGRVIAVLRLVQLAPDDLLVILPRELAATVASRLGKFILRAKVKISDESAGWRVAGLVAPHGAGAHGADDATGAVARARWGAAGPRSSGSGGATMGAADKETATSDRAADNRTVAPTGAGDKETAAAFAARAASWAAAQFEEARAQALEAGEQSFAAAQLEIADSVVELPAASAVMLPDAVNAQSCSGTGIIVRVGAEPARWLVLSPVGEAAPVSGCAVGERAAWRLLDIAAGIPQVYGASSEELVGQMLNLDALDGISFQKGCYTGQEVIARAHYRGRVKRRLQRFRSRGPAKLVAGESGQLADGRAFKVVEACELSDGRCEFLAVAPMAAGAPSSADDEGRPGGAMTQAPAAVAPTGATIDAEQLPLPYPLPD